MLSENTLGHQAYEKLKSLIINGHYVPGQRLYYEEVSKELGVSQTPLKEAFMLLYKEGIVEIKSRRGTYVRKLTRKHLEEYTDVRISLEVLAVELIIRHVTDDIITDLEKSNNFFLDCYKKKDKEQLINADRLFHAKLIEHSKSEVLVSIVTNQPLTNLFGIAEKQKIFLQNGTRIYNEHAKIIDMIRIRDAEKASRMIKEHLTDGKNRLLGLYEQDILQYQ